LRLIVETDAGGDPDDEQSLVRFLLYASEWDVEGIIANRPHAREGENKNPNRTGLAIVRAQLEAYGRCWPNLVKHDPRFPTQQQLWQRSLAGYDDTTEAVDRIIAAVDSNDPRPVWYSDWGTDAGGATNNLRRALDRVLDQRGPEGYAKFKARLRLASADAFGRHTDQVQPPFPLWIDTFRPELKRKRWYHTFSALTATAGGFDVERDLRSGHGPLGALYPLNTTHPQKEGDTMSFLYLIPTGMNDPQEPTWGSWAGRYGPRDDAAGRAYYWANQADAYRGNTSRENTLARWAVALQHDFAARADWCMAAEFSRANHRPLAVLNGDRSQRIVTITARAGERIELSAAGSSDPDNQAFKQTWSIYPEPGTFRGPLELSATAGPSTSLTAPPVTKPATIHVILELEDAGTPSLFAFRRAIIAVAP
jgi:Cellulose-binding Sde182, nucleoside hydrolase-like domain/Cellulose-binding protein Sde0182, C-terminal domain